MHIGKASLIYTVALTGMLAVSGQAKASTVTFDYVGYYFTSSADSLSPGVSVGVAPAPNAGLGTKITASITLQDSALSNEYIWRYNSADFVSGSITNGVSTYSLYMLDSNFITFSNGNIVSWSLGGGGSNDSPLSALLGGNATLYLGTIQNNGNDEDYANLFAQDGQIINTNFNTPGVWTEVASGSPPPPVPLPGAVFLFGSGLIGLTGLGFARRRTVAA